LSLSFLQSSFVAARIPFRRKGKGKVVPVHF
jgi:hypothetical protein